MNKNFKNIQGSKYKALFTYYNIISDKFVRYFPFSVAFCIKCLLWVLETDNIEVQTPMGEVPAHCGHFPAC